MRAFASLLVGCALLLVAGASAAQAETEAKGLVTAAYELVRYDKHPEAIEALEEAARVCRREGCDDPTKAQVYVALGTALTLAGRKEEAIDSFQTALTIDPAVQTDERFTTREVTSAYEAAEKKVQDGETRPPPGPPGFLTEEQKAAIEQARAQLDEGDWEACLQTMIVSTSVEEYAKGKLMLAKCQEAGGLLLEAARDAKAALELAEKDDDRELKKEIEAYTEKVESEIPRIELEIQSGIGDPEVKIDDTVIPEEEVDDPIPHNPGTAVIEVTGERGGQPYEFRQEIKFQRGETIELEVRSDVTPFQACLDKARTLEEREECERIFKPEEGLTVRGALEVASYNDTNQVHVLTPSLSIAAVQPTEGWNVAGSALVDVVTAASADIVTTASRRFDDQRFAAGLNGGYQIGPITPSLSGSFSIESDYIGRTVGGMVSADVADKMLTPYLGYSFGFDTIGRAGTPYDVFSQELFRHTMNFGTSIIFDASTVGAVAATVRIEEGNQSKPYRHVAMFDASLADDMPRGATKELVSVARADIAPLEQLPLERQRYALLVRASHRFDEVTIRGSERGYYDSWSQWASTTDLRLFWDFYRPEGEGAQLPVLTLGPHVRFHVQGPTSFYERAYVVELRDTGYVLPRYRTGDRELGPLFTVTAGASLRAAVTEAVALSFQAEGLYTQFLDHLYIFENYGLFTASALEIEID